jgi:hypothetical protein
MILQTPLYDFKHGKIRKIRKRKLIGGKKHFPYLSQSKKQYNRLVETK